MEARAGFAVSGRRFLAIVLAAFAVVGLGLAAVGVYGVAAYSASRRSREAGIRLALGALPRDVFRLLLYEGGVISVAGVAIGLGLALGLGRLLRTVLFEVDAADPLVLGAAGLVASAAAMLATAIPARRMTRTDPVAALKAE